MTTAAVARLLLSSPLTIFSMESSSLGLLAEAAVDVGDAGEGDDLFGEADRLVAVGGGGGGGGDDGDPFEATLSNADPPEVPMDAEAAVGDSRGENLCRNLSAAVRGDGVEPAPYAEARSGFWGVQTALLWQHAQGSAKKIVPRLRETRPRGKRKPGHGNRAT